MLAGLCAAGAGHSKKLEIATRLWARGELVDEAAHEASEDQAEASLQEQCDRLGVALDGPIAVREDLPAYHLWPECVPAWQLFQAVQTEWRGSAQREGLDKTGVHHIIDMRREWRRDRAHLFALVRIMERAALDEWRKRPS